MTSTEAMERMVARVRDAGGTPKALPIGVDFTALGSWRVYFNRHAAAPLVWCIAPAAGGWEIAVASIGLNAPVETAYAPKNTPDDEDGHPSAWLCIDGQLTVLTTGHASIGRP